MRYRHTYYTDDATKAVTIDLDPEQGAVALAIDPVMPSDDDDRWRVRMGVPAVPLAYTALVAARHKAESGYDRGFLGALIAALGVYIDHRAMTDDPVEQGDQP